MIQKTLGSLQDILANLLNNETGSYGWGADFLYGTDKGGNTLYGGGSISINTRGQVVISYATSNSMGGVVYGAMGGGGDSVGISTGPARSGSGASYVAAGGLAVFDAGAIASASRDAESGSISSPGSGLHGDFAGGLGAGYASGNAQTSTFATSPAIPAIDIPHTGCHL